MADLLTTTDRSRVRRHAERAVLDRAVVDAILDEAHLAHVGVVVDGAPRVLPMAYGRDGDLLYLHGAVGNALLRSATDAEVCVTVTLLDGLVLARSAFHHSMNYRSVVLYGTATRVVDEAEKRRAFDVIVDQMVADRSGEVRAADDGEARATAVLRLVIDEGAAKVRTGPPIDEPADLSRPVWAGVIPVAVSAGPPVVAPGTTVDGLRPPTPERLQRGAAVASTPATPTAR